MTPLLDAHGLSLEDRVRPTDLTVASGELVAVIGPNGSGKTSLLRALAGIEKSSGEIRVDGEDLASVQPQRRPLLATYLPASREAAWPICARDVIALGLPTSDLQRVSELVALLELQDLEQRPIDRLSTGERARVLLARALAPRPKVLLLDEPLSNLDPYWVLRILDILGLAAERSHSALVSLHDIDQVTRFDRVLLMDDGRVRADLRPDEMLASTALSDVFAIEKQNGAWRIRVPADRRSSR